MPQPKYAAKTDANQREIFEKLRAIGATVEDTSKVGGGFPDAVVGFRGENFLLEIKTDEGELNDDQVEWHQHWAGQVAVVRTWQQAYRAIGLQFTEF